MKKLTAANSPLLAQIKAQFNNPIFKAASMLANASGEAAVVDYMGQFYNEDARPAALKRFAALVAEAGPIVKNSQDGNAVTLNQNARVACSNTLGVPLETPISPEKSLHYDGPDPLETQATAPLPAWVEEQNRARNTNPGEAGIAAARAEVAEAETAGPDTRPIQGPIRTPELLALHSVAWAESSETPRRYSVTAYSFLLERGLIEYLPTRGNEGIYILTAAGLEYLADENTIASKMATRERAVMAEECVYWRGRFGNPGPFEDAYDEICYWRKTRGMPPIGAVPSLDRLINDQIDRNPELAVELGLFRR